LILPSRSLDLEVVRLEGDTEMATEQAKLARSSGRKGWVVTCEGCGHFWWHATKLDADATQKWHNEDLCNPVKNEMAQRLKEQ
jgi:glutamate-1-semialdehyde aminotransferase